MLKHLLKQYTDEDIVYFIQTLVNMGFKRNDAWELLITGRGLMILRQKGVKT